MSAHAPSAGAELRPGAPWSLSALVGPAFTTHADEIVAFNARLGDRARVDSVEFRAFSRIELDAALDTIPQGLGIFVELPLDNELDELLPVVRGRGINAKVRTGGIVAETIPGRPRSPASSRPAPPPGCRSRPPPGSTTRCGPSTR